jgi:undecaprenyl-diphosphatase
MKMIVHGVQRAALEPARRAAVSREAMKNPKRVISVIRSEYVLLILIALIGGGAWGFIELADEVLEGETHIVDEAILLSMRNQNDPADPIGPGWVEEIGRDFTALAGVTVVALAVAGHMLLRGRRHATFYLVATVGGGMLLSTFMKMGFDRPRPDLVPHESIVYTASFPSGHSMMAAVVYLTLGALLARMEPRPKTRIYVICVAVFLTIAVGISRVYLGVHWPTDVLAGWTAGATWALLCWLGARALQRRGEIETEDAD